MYCSTSTLILDHGRISSGVREAKSFREIKRGTPTPVIKSHHWIQPVRTTGSLYHAPPDPLSYSCLGDVG